MRRIARPPIEVFNISFLDIISCAFGAIVMLVLLAKNGEHDIQRSSANTSVLIEQVLSAQQYIEELKGAISDKQNEFLAAKSKTSSTTDEKKQLDSSIPRAQKTLAQLQDQAKSLREEIRKKNARLNTPNTTNVPDDEAGGIPTDADYVIFVIDNSGSMVGSGGRGWKYVVSTVNDILLNHPKTKGFQIMAADGTFMYSSKQGKWLPDSKSMRQKVINRMQSFQGGSSAPEVGIIKALKLYKRQTGKVSLYVFGDEFYPGKMDDKVIEITRLNKAKDGTPKFRIHGIGFFRTKNENSVRFAAFMQAIAKRNSGAFVGLYY